MRFVIFVIFCDLTVAMIFRRCDNLSRCGRAFRRNNSGLRWLWVARARRVDGGGGGGGGDGGLKWTRFP